MADHWAALRRHHQRIRDRRIADLFADGERFGKFSATSEGLLLDYSKTNLDEDARALLLALAEATGIEAARDAMFAGAKINTSEGRAVLHTALRQSGDAPVMLDGEDIGPAIRRTRADMERFAEDVRSGVITAADGAPFSDVINIGIGGSDLGPAMAVPALAPSHDGPHLHFVSNIDGAHLSDTLKGLSAARTLVIIASKTFTTIETMTNAASAIRWLEASLGDAAHLHLAAVSSAQDKTSAFGIAPERVFGFGDYVGGRLSLWGPVGLPILLAVGAENFAAFLAGAEAMDRHFRIAPLAENLPVLLALVGIWHRDICLYPTRAVLPYDQRLARLPAYLQQLDMESNGKSVRQDGKAVSVPTGPVVWGEPGTNGQHAFFQLLHQGTDVIPTEFLIAAEGHEPELAHHHALLVANCLAQSEALMLGRRNDAAWLAPHRSFAGNRPSVTLAYKRLTPFRLGQIIALYEHRVFCEAAVWGINAFDQWGVELGKDLATALLPMVEGGDARGKDASTAGLLTFLATGRRGI
ncbi:MAG: glucose-6-phosphate isomerase [Rhodobacteraceae bacterium]|nr:glucose-6-phosphate isomerase [Paracoccaceae bacterium]